MFLFITTKCLCFQNVIYVDVQKKSALTERLHVIAMTRISEPYNGDHLNLVVVGMNHVAFKKLTFKNHVQNIVYGTLLKFLMHSADVILSNISRHVQDIYLSHSSSFFLLYFDRCYEEILNGFLKTHHQQACINVPK